MIKKLAIMCVTLGLLTVFIAGCTTSTTNTTPSTSVTPSSGDMISTLNTYFNSTKSEIMVNPFKQATVENHTAYLGSFKDGADKLTPKIHNYTVFVASNSTDAKMLFAQQVNKTKSAGYVEITPTLDTQWHGYYKSSTSAANGEVYVTVCEPHSCTSTVANEFALRDPSSFVVTVDKISNA